MKRSTRYILGSIAFLALTIWLAFALPSCAFDTNTTFQHRVSGPVIVGTKPDPKDASHED